MPKNIYNTQDARIVPTGLNLTGAYTLCSGHISADVNGIPDSNFLFGKLQQ